MKQVGIVSEAMIITQGIATFNDRAVWFLSAADMSAADTNQTALSLKVAMPCGIMNALKKKNTIMLTSTKF